MNVNLCLNGYFKKRDVKHVQGGKNSKSLKMCDVICERSQRQRWEKNSENVVDFDDLPLLKTLCRTDR